MMHKQKADMRHAESPKAMQWARCGHPPSRHTEDGFAFLKQAIKRGTADLVFDSACQAYRSGQATLSRAAEMAELPLRDMILRMEDADLELNYDVSDLRKDLAP